MDKIDFFKLFFYGKFVKKFHKNAFIFKKNVIKKNSRAKCYLFVFLHIMCKFYQNRSVNKKVTPPVKWSPKQKAIQAEL